MAKRQGKAVFLCREWFWSGPGFAGGIKGICPWHERVCGCFKGRRFQQEGVGMRISFREGQRRSPQKLLGLQRGGLCLETKGKVRGALGEKGKEKHWLTFRCAV